MCLAKQSYFEPVTGLIIPLAGIDEVCYVRLLVNVLVRFRGGRCAI